MRVAVIFVVALALASCVLADDHPVRTPRHHEKFQEFKAKHHKSYAHADEEDKRFNIFADNLDFIDRHEANANRTFTLQMNEFGDLTNEEFVGMLATYRKPTKKSSNTTSSDSSSSASAPAGTVLGATLIPASVNWTALGKVTPIKNQGQCGSCWSFSTTGAVESAYAIAANLTTPISLSEQMLVDCDTSSPYPNYGCGGGNMQYAFLWIASNGGLCTEADYGYKAYQSSCLKATCNKTLTVGGYLNVAAYNEPALQAAVAQQPVSIAVSAGGANWQFYRSGIVPTAGCSTSLNHGVLATGYGVSTAGTPYWIVKNSWGTSWGMSGYILLQRSTFSGTAGTCGIALDGTYPTGARHL